MATEISVMYGSEKVNIYKGSPFNGRGRGRGPICREQKIYFNQILLHIYIEQLLKYIIYFCPKLFISKILEPLDIK